MSEQIISAVISRYQTDRSSFKKAPEDKSTHILVRLFWRSGGVDEVIMSHEQRQHLWNLPGWDHILKIKHVKSVIMRGGQG